MVVKDFKFEYKEWDDGKPYLEMYSDVIIKRNGKLWKVTVRTGFDLSGIEKEFEICLAHHKNHQRRTYYLWQVDPKKDHKDKLINTVSFEFVDEQLTREEYEEKFGEKLWPKEN